MNCIPTLERDFVKPTYHKMKNSNNENLSQAIHRALYQPASRTKALLLAASISALTTTTAAAVNFIDSGQSLGSSDSLTVALGDVDGDGDLDALVANYDQANRVWLNNGSGIFSDSGQSLGSSKSQTLVLGDVDGDGDLDAFVANYSGQANRVWLNNGSGTFSDSGQSLGSSASISVALGDLDGDGDLDAFVTNYNQGNRVWLNNGPGTFSDSGQSLGSSYSGKVVLGDLDGDGDLDAFVVNVQSDHLWLNNGSGAFSDSGQNFSSGASEGVALGDIDGDGDLDAFISHSTLDQTTMLGNRVLLNNGSGTFSDSGLSLGGSWSMEAALGDIDGDGDLDAFVANTLGQANRVYLNEIPTLVVLTEFTAQVTAEGVELFWHTEMELDTAGFNLWRRGANWVKLNTTLIDAQGGFSQYRYVDKTAVLGQEYEYRLEEIDNLAQSVFLPETVNLNVVLKTPANGVTLLAESVPVFSWDGSGVFIFQFSVEGTGEISSWPSTGWTTQTQLAPSAMTWATFTNQNSGKKVFWRVLALTEADEVVYSEVRWVRITE